MDPLITKFLNNHKVDSATYYSHVGLFNPTGRFQFTREQFEELFNLYSESVGKKGIAEKPEQFIPLLADIDLKLEFLPNDKKERLYTIKEVELVIQTYQKILSQVVEDISDEQLICILLEKDPYIDEKHDKCYLKSGYHLHFPFVFINKVDQEVHILPRIKKELKKMNLDDIDNSYIKNAWLMYGSSKSEKHHPYLVSKYYDKNCKEISLTEALTNYHIYDKDEEVISFERNIDYYLPRILSTKIYGRDEYICEIKPNLPSLIKNNIIKYEENTEIRPFRKLTIKENILQLQELMPLVSDWRANEYTEWITIGWALYNLTDGGKEGLDMWLEFSQKCPDKYNEATCLFEWKKMTNKDKYTIGSFKYWAKEDNEEKYKMLKRKRVTDIIEKTLESENGTHNDIAKTLFEECEEEFKCASLHDKTWFQFQNHGWKEIEEGIYLRLKISNELWDLYEIKHTEYMKKWKESKDNKKPESMKIIEKIMKNLKSSPFKNNIMKEAMEFFYDAKFNDKIDANPWIIGFQNGVYDLKTCTFRDGHPSDYISMKMAVEYDEAMTDTHPTVCDVYDFLEKIFPDKSIRTYFLDISSDIFVGGNQNKIIQFWSGEGDNGKSITQILFEKMLGNYSIKLPTSLITGKRTQSSAACPELVRAGNGVRWIVLQEPDQKDFLNIGVLKELSGNDTYYARGLYKKGKEITPMFTVAVICNNPPKAHGDRAFWNRLRIIPFESTFCDNAPTSYEEQLLQKRFPKDKHFADRIPHMTKAFAWVLLNHRKSLNIRIEPEKVKLATASYQKRNDVYRQFFDECIMDDKMVILSITELYTQFKEWFRDSLPGQKVPIKNDVKEYFIRLWGNPRRGGKWKGYRIRTLQDNLPNPGESEVI